MQITEQDITNQLAADPDYTAEQIAFSRKMVGVEFRAEREEGNDVPRWIISEGQEPVFAARCDLGALVFDLATQAGEVVSAE
jgi:hypothetical protein